MKQRARAIQRYFSSLVILLLAATSVAAAQDGRQGEQCVVPSRTATRAGIARLSRPLATALAADSTSHVSAFGSPASLDPSRSKVVAGVASGLIPGLGSFYASHVRHGITHLTVHVVAGTLALAGSVSCISAWGGETECKDRGTQLVAAAWLVNWGWSIITAINDAGAFNGRHPVR